MYIKGMCQDREKDLKKAKDYSCERQDLGEGAKD